MQRTANPVSGKYRHRNKHGVTRQPKDHVLVDTLRHNGVEETVYYAQGRSHITRDINKAQRFTLERANEKRRSWGGEAKYCP